MALSAIPVLTGAGGWVYAHEIEPANVEITRLTLFLPRLASAFDGLRLVQISDLHMDSFMTRARLVGLMDQVNAARADVVAITGDFITGDPARYADDLIAVLRRLMPAVPVLAVLGNHDHWGGAEIVRGILRETPVLHIGNDVFVLRRAGDVLSIGGVDDYWERQDRLDVVLDRLPLEGAALLLAHEPDYADLSAVTGRFDLQLSGHTHGGQVVLPLIGPPILPHYGRKYPAGLYRVDDMLLYTNRGLGMVRPRVRFNCRPEIAVFTLRSAGG
jgi:hypothetical protein